MEFYRHNSFMQLIIFDDVIRFGMAKKEYETTKLPI